jgi:hypothetical protein
MSYQAELTPSSPAGDDSPILYVRPSPECDEVVIFLERNNIAYVKKDVSRDPVALLEMQHKSRQHNVPVLDWRGRLISNFNLDQLRAFLVQESALPAESAPEPMPAPESAPAPQPQVA